MTTRDRTALLLVVIVAAVAASWLLVIGPQRDQAGKLAGQVTAAQTQLDSARAQVAQDAAARSAFGHNYAVIARLGEAVPADDNVPSLIYQLQSAASGSRVDFRSLQLGGSGAPAPSSTTSTASGAGQSGSSALPPGATIGPAGFPIEPFTFVFHGNFFHLADFLGRLQRFVVATDKRVWVSGRLMTLNSISLAAGPGGFPQIAATIAATTYLVPSSQGLTNGAGLAGPAAAGTVPVSSAPSSAAAPTAAIGSPLP